MVDSSSGRSLSPVATRRPFQVSVRPAVSAPLLSSSLRAPTAPAFSAPSSLLYHTLTTSSSAPDPSASALRSFLTPLAAASSRLHLRPRRPLCPPHVRPPSPPLSHRLTLSTLPLPATSHSPQESPFLLPPHSARHAAFVPSRVSFFQQFRQGVTSFPSSTPSPSRSVWSTAVLFSFTDVTPSSTSTPPRSCPHLPY